MDRDMTLDWIASKCGADKSHRLHDYCWVYEKYIAELRDLPISLLEIGVAEGESLRMWTRYFPNGKIYGVEILDRDYEGLKVFHGSACDPEVVAKMPQFDIVVDDGSHLATDQIAAFDLLWDHLNHGGLYVVEDLTMAYWVKDMRSMEKFFGLVDTCNWHGKIRGTNYKRCRGSDCLDKMEREVEFVHFYTGLVFVKKRKEP